jgi:sugar/nucleoside kinase (ribokinase family)
VAPEREGAGPDIVIVGAASRDLAASDPRGWRLGGAAAYCALAAARLGLRVGCLLGVDDQALAAAELATLREAGVDLRPVSLVHGPVFDNIERDGHRRQRWLSASDRIPAGALPEEWRRAASWLFVPVAGEIGAEWAATAGSRALVAVGPQGMLRRFGGDGWVERVEAGESPLLRRAGLVCASVDDLASERERAALTALAPDAVIVLTEGDAGGAAVAPDGRETVRYVAMAAPHVADPTGAGDVFLAALMASWLLTGECATPEALRFAAAAGSCSVEGVGLAGVPTRAQVEARLAADEGREG